jgi:hypothetical protein
MKVKVRTNSIWQSKKNLPIDQFANRPIKIKNKIQKQSTDLPIDQSANRPINIKNKIKKIIGQSKSISRS